VSYGGGDRQKMDIYQPAGRSKETTKAIVLIHGGSWTSGNKTDLTAYVDSFKKRMPDLAIININYRLAGNGVTLAAAEQDVKAAIEAIAGSAGEWGINKDAIGMLGVSAGAHLALLHAYKQTSPVGIKAIVDFFGPTDLVTMYQQPWHPLVTLLLNMATGTTPDADMEMYRNLSPIQFVTAQSPPTLILHGDADEVVAVSQSIALKAKLDAAGATSQMQVYEREGHGWYGAKMAHSFDLVQAFLNQHL
ncbi:MAG: prolyl oligopeptidase family serine peptidase, partial [Chitinophagaceae bacterium]